MSLKLVFEVPVINLLAWPRWPRVCAASSPITGCLAGLAALGCVSLGRPPLPSNKAFAWFLKAPKNPECPT